MTATPVMSGVMKNGAPPETPFLTSDGGKVMQTPVMDSFNVIKTTQEVHDGQEETKKEIIVSSGGHTFHKLNFNRIPEEKKRSKPPIGINALSRSNVKTVGEDGQEEEIKGVDEIKGASSSP